MRLGIGLPTSLQGCDRRLVLEWARVADLAGFHALGTVDKPNYDSWDPLVSLAAAAAVTERIRLSTTILQLPNRDEVLVAKQAAVVDQVSGGRLDLGLAIGGRPDDFEVFGAPFAGRAERFEKAVPHIREVWQQARTSDEQHGTLGPAPVQRPGPPIWIGGTTEPAIMRSARLGDGFIFAGGGAGMIRDTAQRLRSESGRDGFTIAALVYCAIGDDPKTCLDEATRHLVRYYGRLWAPPEQIVLHGPGERIADGVAEYADAGVDVLYLFPYVANVLQVHRLAETVLPPYGDERPTGRAEAIQDKASKDSFPASDPPAHQASLRSDTTDE